MNEGRRSVPGERVSRDMSPEAIARRLEIASELRELWRILSRAKRLGPAEGPSKASSPESGQGPSGEDESPR